MMIFSSLATIAIVEKHTYLRFFLYFRQRLYLANMGVDPGRHDKSGDDPLFDIVLQPL